jgi:hypothetical protein
MTYQKITYGYLTRYLGQQKAGVAEMFAGQSGGR